MNRKTEKTHDMQKARVSPDFFAYHALTSMIFSCVSSYSVSVQMMSVIRATASSLKPSIGAGTATVTAPLPM